MIKLNQNESEELIKRNMHMGLYKTNSSKKEEKRHIMLMMMTLKY